jgi:hypothetical protein
MDMRKCPDCQSQFFHIREDADGNQYLCCYRVYRCGWRVKIQSPVDFVSEKTTK